MTAFEEVTHCCGISQLAALVTEGFYVTETTITKWTSRAATRTRWMCRVRTRAQTGWRRTRATAARFTSACTAWACAARAPPGCTTARTSACATCPSVRAATDPPPRTRHITPNMMTFHSGASTTPSRLCRVTAWPATKIQTSKYTYQYYS
jgi:hypothetical protein